jgi:hypothetical protein
MDSTVGERRVLVTEAVGEVWQRFVAEKRDMIIHSFQKTGIALPIDGLHCSPHPILPTLAKRIRIPGPLALGGQLLTGTSSRGGRLDYSAKIRRQR